MSSLTLKFSGDTKHVVHHQCLHALGLAHEQHRPDRDDYINIFPERYRKDVPDQTWKYTMEDWEDTGFPFDLKSAMMVSSYSFKKMGQTSPPMSLKDGTTWGMHGIASTTDVLQLKKHYCSGFPDTPEKKVINCPNPDSLGIIRPIFADRVCDSVPDCEDGADEDGRMGECRMPAE